MTVSIPPIINLTYVMFLIDFFLSLYPFLSLSFLNCTNPPPHRIFCVVCYYNKDQPLACTSYIKFFSIATPKLSLYLDQKFNFFPLLLCNYERLCPCYFYYLTISVIRQGFSILTPKYIIENSFIKNSISI